MGYFEQRAVETVVRGQVFTFADMDLFDVRWFERGRIRVLSGAGAGLVGIIKHDKFAADRVRVIELWEPLRALIAPGDVVRLEAGCDKRGETCQLKFNNFLNFRGFPDIPGEDWLMSVPTGQGDESGGSLRG